MFVTEHLARARGTLFSYEIIPPPRGRSAQEILAIPLDHQNPLQPLVLVQRMVRHRVRHFDRVLCVVFFEGGNLGPQHGLLDLDPRQLTQVRESL